MWPEQRVVQFVNRQVDPEFRRIDAWERRVIKTWLSSLSVVTLLDAPCGFGRFFDLWAECSKYVLAVDSSSEMCRRARVKAKHLALEVAVIQSELPSTDIYDVGVAVCIRLWAHLDRSVADSFLVWLLATAPFVILQINESNRSPETSELLQNGQYRLDSIDRIAQVLKTKGGIVRAVDRFSPSQSTASLLLIERLHDIG